MTSVSCSSVLNRALAQGVKSGAVTGGSDNVRLGDWAAQLAGRRPAGVGVQAAFSMTRVRQPPLTAS